MSGVSGPVAKVGGLQFFQLAVRIYIYIYIIHIHINSMYTYIYIYKIHRTQNGVFWCKNDEPMGQRRFGVKFAEFSRRRTFFFLRAPWSPQEFRVAVASWDTSREIPAMGYAIMSKSWPPYGFIRNGSSKIQ